MKSKVYLIENEKKLPELMARFDHPEGKVAIKVHFGEKGNTRYVKPDMIRPIAEHAGKGGGKVFLTDANSLYRGSRLTGRKHRQIAIDHGFGMLGLDIIIADGETGDDEEDIRIDKTIFKSVKIAKAIADADAIVAVSHFKGHMMFGFGGALKNLGMGCGSRAGKLAMHSKIKPKVTASRCISCGICVENCAVDGIRIEGKARINENCIGCAKCISTCPKGAIEVPWGGATSEEAQKRTAEYAYGAILGKRIICVNFVKDITSDCDCMADSQIIAPDIGIFASTDPVALDQACHDMMKRKFGKDIFLEHHGVDGTTILKHAEEIGLGRRRYELVSI